MDKVYDIQKAIVMETEVVLSLLDTRYNAVMIIRPSGDKFEISEPDGEERISWLLRLGVITMEQALTEASGLKTTQKRKLVELLQKQLE